MTSMPGREYFCTPTPLESANGMQSGKVRIPPPPHSLHFLLARLSPGAAYCVSPSYRQQGPHHLLQWLLLHSLPGSSHSYLPSFSLRGCRAEATNDHYQHIRLLDIPIEAFHPVAVAVPADRAHRSKGAPWCTPHGRE